MTECPYEKNAETAFWGLMVFYLSIACFVALMAVYGFLGSR